MSGWVKSNAVRIYKGKSVTLENAIKKLAEDNIDGTNDWYSWRAINESKLPNGICLPQWNQ